MADYPKINGHVFDFSSIELTANGQIFLGVTEINSTQSLEPGIIRGTSAQKIGRTRGEYDSTGSMSMYLEDFREFIAGLGDGYGEVSWDATITFSTPGTTTRVTKLLGCRITTDAEEASQSTDGLVTAFDIDIMQIEKDGLRMIVNALV
jgi:hypothetical protein